MCSRAYSTYTADELYFVYLNRKLQQGESPFEKPNYNFSPTQNAPIVRLVDGAREIDEMTWGLIPEWSSEFKMKFSTIPMASCNPLRKN